MKRFTILAASAVLFLGQCVSSFAAVSPTPVFVQNADPGIIQFLQGSDSAGTYKTMTFTQAGAQGWKCTGMRITSNDAVSHLVTIQFVRGSTKLGGTAIATGTTTPGFASGAGAINAMSPTNWPGLSTDSDSNPYFFLANASDTIQATFATALTSTDVINIVADCAAF